MIDKLAVYTNILIVCLLYDARLNLHFYYNFVQKSIYISVLAKKKIHVILQHHLRDENKIEIL